MIRSHEQRHAVIGQLPMAVIDGRPRFALDGSLADIADHTDDRRVRIFVLHPDHQRLAQADPLRQTLFHERSFTTNPGVGFASSVAVNSRPRSTRNTQRAEITWRHHTNRGARHLRPRHYRRAADMKLVPALGPPTTGRLVAAAADSTQAALRIAANASRKNADDRSPG